MNAPGFERETRLAVTFDEIAARWSWSPIRNCPGRFALTQGPSSMGPQEVVGHPIVLTEFRTAQARDPVIVGKLDDGGLISYRRGDGTYVHTLNSLEGFERKLQQLRISLT